MNNAFLRGFLKGGLILPHQIHDSIIPRCLGRTQLFFQCFEFGFDGSVSLSSDHVLFCPFFCGFVVGQFAFTPCIRRLNFKKFDISKPNIYKKSAFLSRINLSWA